jgi:hypothetical protein
MKSKMVIQYFFCCKQGLLKTLHFVNNNRVYFSEGMYFFVFKQTLRRCNKRHVLCLTLSLGILRIIGSSYT